MNPKLNPKRSGATAAIRPRLARGRPQSVPDEIKRETITEVACRLFLEGGYQGIAMGEVAAAAHVSLSTVYRLFPRGKLELFSVIVAEHRRGMIALPGDYDELPIERALEKIFLTDIDLESERRRAEVVRMFVMESQRFPELRSIVHDDGPEYSRKLLTDWLEQQRAAGRISVINVSITAGMLLDVAFGMSAPKFSGDPNWNGVDERATYLRTCFATIVNGLKPQHPEAQIESLDGSMASASSNSTDEGKEKP